MSLPNYMAMTLFLIRIDQCRDPVMALPDRVVVVSGRHLPHLNDPPR